MKFDQPPIGQSLKDQAAYLAAHSPHDVAAHLDSVGFEIASFLPESNQNAALVITGLASYLGTDQRIVALNMLHTVTARVPDEPTLADEVKTGASLRGIAKSVSGVIMARAQISMSN